MSDKKEEVGAKRKTRSKKKKPTKTLSPKKRSSTKIISMTSKVDEAKEQFLSLVTHEIRTPLTGIAAAAQMIPRAGPLNEKQGEHMRQLNECTAQLLCILNDILDLAQIRSGRLIIRNEPFLLLKTVQGAVDVLKASIDEKGLGFSLNIGEGLPAFFVGDASRLKQIIINLLSNSVKYTDRGEIELVIYGDKIEDTTQDVIDSWRIWFSVRDTGLGIAKKNQRKIFQMFEQESADKRYTSDVGVGIGLAIVKNLVAMMGGEISVSSEGVPGKGSTFTFSILVKEKPNLDDMIKENRDLFNRSKVLVVDDKQTNRILLNKILFGWGIHPITVESAEEALQYAKSGFKFDIAIIDIHMPFMSGIELAQKLTGIDNKLPLIAISSVGDVNQETSIFDYFLEKPINEYKLFPCVLDALTKEFDHQLAVVSCCKEMITTSSSSPKRKKALNKKSCKIILAEDDSHNRFAIKELLLDFGFSKNNITIVKNGKSCVDKVKKGKFDICLMDIRMPGMDGITATKHIMILDNAPNIIGISAGGTDTVKHECHKAGMIAYITKPIDIEEFRGVLEKLIERDA